MRFLTTLPVLVLAVAFADAADKPKTKAEYDELVKPLHEKSDKAKAEVADAEKRIKAVSDLPGMSKGVQDYARSLGAWEQKQAQVAEMKAKMVTLPKAIEEAERGAEMLKKKAADALAAIAEKHPTEAKDLEAAFAVKNAASKTMKDTDAAIRKLGPAPKK